MKLYLCCLENSQWQSDSNGWKALGGGNYVHFTTDKEEALQWKRETQAFELAAALDGFRGPDVTVVRDGGLLPDQGPVKVLVSEGTGAGRARVFELEVDELLGDDDGVVGEEFGIFVEMAVDGHGIEIDDGTRLTAKGIKSA